MKSFELRGQADPRLAIVGPLSVISCLLLCFSTASISDGGDLNYELYYFGSRAYWVLSLFIIYRTANVYRELWEISAFVPSWSFEFKNYGGYLALILIFAHSLQYLQVINLGNYLDWGISLFIVTFIGTLYWDLANMDLLLRRK
jgi:hypothetical protein